LLIHKAVPRACETRWAIRKADSQVCKTDWPIHKAAPQACKTGWAQHQPFPQAGRTNIESDFAELNPVFSQIPAAYSRPCVRAPAAGEIAEKPPTPAILRLHRLCLRGRIESEPGKSKQMGLPTANSHGGRPVRPLNLKHQEG